MLPEIKPKGPFITEEMVTRFFKLRSEIWSSTPLELNSRYPEYFDGEESKYLPEYVGHVKKEILVDWYSKNICQINDREEYLREMESLLEQIKIFLNEKGMFANFHLFGSYSIGNSNIGSDLDFLAVLPRIEDNQDNIFKEVEKWKGLGSFIVFSRELGSFENLYSIYSKGNGLARLYGFSRSGIEVEFHVIGISDVNNLHKLFPGYIERISPVSPKKELRTSFKGKRELIPKAADRVQNYILSKEDRDEDCFVGFFPLHMAVSNLIYQGLPNADYIKNSFLALVKGFLFYNSGYIRNSLDEIIGINSRFLTEEGFLNFVSNVFYYNNVSKYSEKKLIELRQMYFATLEDIGRRYNLSFI
jgi:predicted nucleotidyltransferase